MMGRISESSDPARTNDREVPIGRRLLSELTIYKVVCKSPKNTKPSDFDIGGLCVLGNQNGYLIA
jgi:hypothetical protein